LLNPSKDQVNEIIKWSQNELEVGLEMEKIYRYVVLSERKKNYFGVYPDSSIDVKGLMGKKRNTPPFLQDGFKQVLEILSQVKTLKEFEKAKKEVKNLVRSIYQTLEKKNYSAEELAITMQLSQSLDSYKVKSQHFKAATQLEEHYQKKYMETHGGQRRKSPFIKAGQLIRFIKTQTGDRVIPLELMTDPSKIDVKSYISMVDSIFDQLFGALDIEVEEVATGQVNLMEFFGKK
jgi:DNA polymerase I